MEVTGGSEEIVFNRRKSPKTVETREATTVADALSLQKVTSVLKQVVRMNVNSIQDNAAVTEMKQLANLNIGQDENESEKGALSRQVMKHLAGWSAVKMFERYVPEVVMQQIILEVTASMKSMAKQNSMRSSLRMAGAAQNYSLKQIRRKSLRLKKSLMLQQLQEKPQRDGGKVTIEENCTVVLADISGFTKLADKLSKRPDGSGTEILSSKLNKYFGRMIDMIYAGGGDVIKFAGDALLVVWRENKKPVGETEGTSSKQYTSGKARIDAITGASSTHDNGKSKNQNRTQQNLSRRKTVRRKRSSIHVLMSNRSLTRTNGSNNTRTIEHQPSRETMNATADSAGNSQGWRSQMKHFRDTIGDKKMNDKSRRDRALTSKSDRRSNGSQNSFENLAVYRGSNNDSDISKKKSNEDASKPVEKAIEIGPEVTDFVAMIREELENGKLSPEQYLNVVRQRYDLYFQGLLNGMGDAVSAIRREQQTEMKSEDKKLSKLRELAQKMMSNIELKNRRGDRNVFFKYYTNCFVGEDAVTWLLEQKHCSEVKEALALGNIMLTTCLIVQLTGKKSAITRFENNKNLYRFTDIAVQSSLAKGTGHKASERKRGLSDDRKKSGASRSFRSFLQQAMNKRQSPFGNQKYKVSNSDTVWAGRSNSADSTIAPVKNFKKKEQAYHRQSTPVDKASSQLGGGFQETIKSKTKSIAGKIDASIHLENDYGRDIEQCSDATFAAVHTCLKMIRTLDKFEGLRLHVGIGVGKTFFMHLGGVLDRWEFVMAGEALVQMSMAEEEAEAGDLCVSGEVWKRIGQYCYGHPTVTSMGKGFSLLGKRSSNGDTAVHVVVGTKALPMPNPCKRRWETWEDEKHYLIQDYIDVDLPLMLANRILNYVPGAVRDLLKQLHLEAFERSSFGGNTTVVEYDKSRLFEFRTVSVLFINLPGIDYNASKSAVLNTLQSSLVIMQEEIYFLEGSVRQFIMDDKGTTLIGVFGLYPAHDNDPYLAIKCALNIVKGLEDLDLFAKVGITTGTVFAAEVGSGRRCEYAIIGDVVNMSARLMAATFKLNKRIYDKVSILCDEATYRATASKFRFMRLRPITVKGKDEPQRIFSPLSIRSARTFGRNAKMPFVCREKEIELLGRLVEPIVSRSSAERILLIEGDVGVGKTRLANEFLETCRMLIGDDIFICRVIANKLQVQRPYGVLRSFFTEILDFFDDRGFCLLNNYTTSPWKLDGDFKRLVPYILKRRQCLRDIVCFDSKDHSDKSDATHPKKNNYPNTSTTQNDFDDVDTMNFLVALVELYILTSSLPMVILSVAHVDRCDKYSLMFLQKLVSNSATKQWPLLVVSTLRIQLSSKILAKTMSESTQGAEYHSFIEDPAGMKGLLRIPLPSFDKRETKEYIAAYLNCSVPKGLTTKIYSRTGGNALYIKEVVDALVSSAVLIEEGGTFKLNEVVVEESTFSVPLPDTMKSTYQEIIDRLNSDSLWILTIASVASYRDDSFTDLAIQHVYGEVGRLLRKNDDAKGNLPTFDGGHGSLNNVMNRQKHWINEVLLSLVNKHLIAKVGMLPASGNMPVTLYRFTRWELKEVMYTKASFNARRRLHAATSAFYISEESRFLSDFSERDGNRGSKSINRSNSVEVEYSLSDSQLPLFKKAHKLLIIGSHFERALDYERAILNLSRALLIYQRLYAYPYVIETIKDMLYILDSEDYNERSLVDGGAEKLRRSSVHLRRQLGEVYLKIGRFNKAYPLLEGALRLCDIDPSSLDIVSKPEAALKLEKLLKTWNQIPQETQLPQKNSSFYLLFESGQTFLSLSQHYLATGTPVVGVSPLIKALELSLIPKGPSSLLVSSFGVASHYLYFYLLNKTLAYKCIDAAKSVSKKIYDPPSLAFVNRLSCEIKICNAELDSAITEAKRASEISGALGDTPDYQVSKRLEGDCLYFKGNIVGADKCFLEGLSKASNIQTFEHVWNEVGRARCLLLSLDRKIDLDSSITVCNDFLGSFSAKAIKILAGSKLVGIQMLTIIKLYRSPEDIRQISRRQIDTVLENLVDIESYNSGMAFCQAVEFCLGIWEAMLLMQHRRKRNHARSNNKDDAILGNMRLRFLFGFGFLVPDAGAYLSKIYPLSWVNKYLPDKLYRYLKILSNATKTFAILTSSYKRLSGIFHALSKDYPKAKMKFEQSVAFADSCGMELESTRSLHTMLRYLPNRYSGNVCASLLMEYSHKYNDMGATMLANAAQLEAQVLKRKSVFMKLLQNQSKWLEFQKASTVEELRVMVRQFITNR